MTVRTSRLSVLAAPRFVAWLPALAVAASAAVRLLALGRKSLWLDESATIRFASTRIPELLGPLHDPHPPLYYILMHYWIALGQSEVVLRLPSAIAGVAAVALLYWVIREREAAPGAAWAAAAGAWLLALNPLHIWYSQEARMYALVCALGLLSTLCYLRAIQRRSWLYWAAWVLATAAGLYTDYSVLLLVFCQVMLYGYFWRKAGGDPGMVFAGPLALLTVVLLYEPQARALLLRVVDQPEGILWYSSSIRPTLERLLPFLPAGQLHKLLVAALALGGCLAAALGNWVLLRRRERLSAGPLLFWAALCVYAGLLAAAPITRGLSLKRQLLVLLPYAVAALAVTLARQPDRTRLTLVCVLLTLPAAGYAVLGQAQDDWRGTAQFIEQRETDRDVILIHSAYNQAPFDYYYTGQLDRRGVQLAALPALQQLGRRYDRAWLVLNNEQYDDPGRTAEAWMDAHYHALGERDLARVRVKLYDLRH